MNCPDTGSTVYECTFAIAAVMEDPFNLQLGDSIFAKVLAYNAIGESALSTAGNGATVFQVIVPDAPVNLQRVSAETTTSQIGISWEDGPNNGGEAILDYRVSYD